MKKYFESYDQRAQWLVCFVLLEYVCMLWSGAGFASLSSAPYFSIGVDPVYWFFYLFYIPQWIISQPWLCVLLDITIVCLMSFMLFQRKTYVWLFRSLFFLLLMHYVTLTGFLGHRNFQSGYVWVIFPFLFGSSQSRIFGREATRYFILLFYLSAAMLKLIHGGIIHPESFVQTLKIQWIPYLAEHSSDWRLIIIQYLLKHSKIVVLLYMLGFVLEMTLSIGFFTKKFDKILSVLLLILHLGIWCFMDIAPIGQISFILSLWIYAHTYSGTSKK